MCVCVCVCMYAHVCLLVCHIVALIGLAPAHKPYSLLFSNMYIHVYVMMQLPGALSMLSLVPYACGQ